MKFGGKMYPKGILFGSLCGASLLVFSSLASAGVLCPVPKPGLKMGDPNVDAETLSFSFQSESFPIDIYSGYAAQNSGNNANFCIRYEVVNKGSHPVEKFYWPLAAGLQMDHLGPQERPSILVTTPPGRPPTIDETWLYAFLSGAKKSFAYQKHAFYQPHSTVMRFSDSLAPSLPNSPPIQLTSNALNQPIQLAQFSGASERLLVKEPTKFPIIGSQFTNSDTEVTATSEAQWNGKSYLISVSISRSNEKNVFKIQAPFTLALLKQPRQDALLMLVKEMKSVSLPLKDNSFAQTVALPLETSPAALYVVKQPITFFGPNGRVCFLAAAYSPIPIPEGYADCGLRS